MAIRSIGDSARLTGIILAAVLMIAPFARAAEPSTTNLRKLTVAAGSTSFAWLPLYVAVGAGYFKDEGLSVEIIPVAANTTPIAAILSGGADIAGIGVQAAFAAADKHQRVKILTPMTTEYTSIIFARKTILKERGVSRNAPLKDRIAALKGLRLATTAVGAGPDLMYRFLFATYAPEIDPDRDVTIVPIGDSRNTLAAMSKGLIDVSAFSPPVPQKAVADGYADVLIDTIAGDVPAAQGLIYTALAVTEQKSKTDAAALRGFVRAIARADLLVHEDIVEAGKAARSFMSQMDSNLYDAGVRAMVPAIPKTPEVPVDGLKKYMALLNVGKFHYSVDYDMLTVNDLVGQALAEKK